MINAETGYSNVVAQLDHQQRDGVQQCTRDTETEPSIGHHWSSVVGPVKISWASFLFCWYLYPGPTVGIGKRPWGGSRTVSYSLWTGCHSVFTVCYCVPLRVTVCYHVLPCVTVCYCGQVGTVCYIHGHRTGNRRTDWVFSWIAAQCPIIECHLNFQCCTELKSLSRVLKRKIASSSLYTVAILVAL